MLRSASREESIASNVDSWERFCREEARQAASSFLERVKRFKSRNVAARDVHDSTFTNEFSAAFLEESSVIMASGNTQLGCAINGQAQSNAYYRPNDSTRSGAFARIESKTSIKSSSSNSSGGKKAWWSHIFKWPKSKRRNQNSRGLSSSGEYGSRPSGNAQRRVILDGHLQLLDLSETVGPLLWTPCKLVLAEVQSNFQVEIFIPPKSAVPKTTLFCFLIDDVRSTTALELPDSTSCFVIKSQNHNEHVFNAETDFKKQRWIQALLDCKNQIIRSASAQTHLATLPRTPQRTPVRLPNGSAAHHGNGVISLDSSPNVHSHQRYGIPTSYASSDSSEQKKSTLNVGADSDGEDNMVDITSLIRRLNHSSPSRRRKVQSMFVDSHLHSIYPAPVAATAATTSMATTSSSHYHPPPPLSYSPPNYEDDYPHQPPSLPARLPYSSLPVDPSPSSPPPLPKRNPLSRGGCSASFSGGHKLPPRTSPSPSHLPPGNPSVSSTAPLSLPATLNAATATANSASGTTRALVSPRRKYSQPYGIDIPPTIPSDSSNGNLELCSQSSSSSALHPVSLVAVQRSMGANGRRKSSITSNPGDGDVTQPMSLMNSQAFQKPNDKVRKMSAPVMIPGEHTKLPDESVQKKLANGIPEQDDCLLDDIVSDDITNKEATSAASQSDREHREQEELKQEKGEESKQYITLEQQSAANASAQSVNANSALSSLSHAQRRDRMGAGTIELDDDYDDTTARKAMLTFRQGSQASNSMNVNGSCTPPPRRTSSPLFVQQRVTATNVSPQATPDLVTCHFRQQLQRQGEERDRDRERLCDEDTAAASASGGTAGTGPLVAGTLGSPLVVNDRDTQEEGRGQNGQRSQSQASNHTDPSTRTNSLSDEVESITTGRVIGGSSTAMNNPIYVETTENGGQGTTDQQLGRSHTQHPYEHWATNQQDVANLRLLSQYPWFHGMVSRANASQLVLAEGESGTGQYLVRQSESREGDFVLTFNYHNRAKHLRMAVDDSGCNIQHLWFDDVPSMLEYFKINSIPLESFWLNDDVKLTNYIDRQASDSFRTTTVVNMDRLSRVPPRRSRSLHLGMANSVNTAANNASSPDTPVPLDANASSTSSSNSQSTNSLPQSARNSTGWRLFRSQRSSSAGNVGRVQRRHSANVGSLLSTGPNSHRSSGRRRRNNENAYLVRNY